MQTWEKLLADSSSSPQHGKLHEGGRVNDVWRQTLLSAFQLIPEIQSLQDICLGGKEVAHTASYPSNQNYCVSISSNSLV